jgi:glycogen operon protein
MGSGLPDVWWFRPDGRKMTRRDWENGDGHRLGVFLNGQEIPTRGAHGEPIGDHSFVLLFNADGEACDFVLPPRRFGLRWALELTTVDPGAAGEIVPARAAVPVESRSLVLLRRDF